MKKLFTLLTVLSLAAPAYSQVYDNPESVEYDAVNNRWLISNTGSGEIFSRDAAGNLTVFASAFASGPHGLEIVGNSVYACAGGNLRILDLTTGAQTALISIGASFLNGITHDNNGNIFMTDFTAKKIYRYNIASQQFYTFVTGLTPTPNGIVFDEGNNRLVVVNWGNSAPVLGINLSDSTVSTLASTSLNYCDGVTMDCDGNFYISTWQPAKIVKYDNGFTTSSNVVTSGLVNPVDIYFAQTLDTLGVPNAGGNNVSLHYFSSCLTNSIAGNENESSFEVITMCGGITIKFSSSENAAVTIFDTSGRLILSLSDKENGLIPLSPGIYIVNYSGKNKKIVVSE